MMILDVIKVIFPAALSFGIGIALTPLLTHYLYKYKAWKKKPRSHAVDGREATIFNALHGAKEVGTPRMGGIVIWLSSLMTIGGIWLLAQLSGNGTLVKLDFLSRDQTWIPLLTLNVGARLSLVKRLLVVAGLSLFVGWWFYAKLAIITVGLFSGATLTIGVFIIPLFILVALVLYAGGIIDGLDGLAGGVFAGIFLAYAGIAFYQGQVNLAAFSATIAGATLAFLWFNVPPARFYMSETGTMGLTMTLAV